MANVKFLRGTQAHLNKYLYTYTGNDAVQAEEGSFYLTEDTNRLYIGKQISTNNVKAVPINQGAIPVDDVNGLPRPSAAVPGQFYYVVSNNILAVASQGQWVQINVNTNTDNFINERQMIGSVSGNKAVITDVLYNTNNAQLSSEIDYIGAEGLSVSVAPTYALAKQYISGTTYYTRSGDVYSVAATQPTEIDQGQTTYYIRRGYALTLTPPVYTLTGTVTSNDLTLSLNDGTHNSDVTLKSGSNVLISEANDEITISATDTTVDHVYAGSGNGPNARQAYDDAGNIVTQHANGFYVQIHNSNNAVAGVAIDPQIRVGSAQAYQQTVQFSNGIAALPVYTTTEVDNKFRLFNAMEYQGTIDSSTFLTVSRGDDTVKNGYVWMASGDISIGNRTAHAGDLILAHGTEESNGFIDHANISWDIVTSGASFDTEPIMDNSSAIPHGFQIKKSAAGGGAAILGTFQVAVNSTASGAVNYLSINDTITGTTALTKVVRIEHTETNPTTTADTTHRDANNANIQMSAASASNTTLDIPVPVVSYDAAGHITGITTYLYQVVDSHATIANNRLAATSSTTASATITSSFTVDGAIKSGAMDMSSSTIKFYADNNGSLTMNIEWDTFN